MNRKDYQYDVAFSFLREDEDLAMQINDFIQDRVSTFIYSRQQDKLVGKDGGETFSDVFEKESRIVVVLYRESWGETGWTRIEATGIRNRAFVEGFDFAIFIPLDKPPLTPRWLPKTQIWMDLGRWGVQSVASFIEKRVSETGGSPREETVEDRIARINREITEHKKRQNFLGSIDGVQIAEQEVKTIFLEIERLANLSPDKTGITFSFKYENTQCIIIGSFGLAVSLRWERPYGDTLLESHLYLNLYQPVSRYKRGAQTPNELDEIIFNFDITSQREGIWHKAEASEKNFSTRQLAQFSIMVLLDHILKIKPWIKNQASS